MQSVPGGKSANKHDRHFANPSVGWANYPPKKPVARPPARFKRLPASLSAKRSAADLIWRAVPFGTARLAVFISVSAQHVRTPMNSPLVSARLRQGAQREAGFEEGCSSN
ncbi:hypothetical protein [Trinickia fusca]|uniref:Uncharacterized protein n=1 Tax=Trinickia fusca TaxID=2419777 RepID=A0A494XSS5_9BURK|nr:hypothetical protein [Trinickia fusca]RKP51164.1 hypothetical protein D7S89_08985 [Trinickia fusca]